MADARPTLGDATQPVDPVRVPPLPTFTEFYRAINRRDPFPWQARLANRVARKEQWPPEIGVPTGLGKTACLDIAVWWLASQSDRAPERRTAPTRIWWVVNRRLLVDSTAEHARDVARALRDPSSAGLDAAGREVIERVAERLRSLWVDPAAPPLDVISLRGGIASRTPTDPARPTVVLCTLPMYGSRLLFRGYGSSRRSVDAAMAGTDSLVLLDEAHLAGHLRALVPSLALCNPGARNFLGTARSRPTVVSLTATGDATQSERFDLDDEDKAHSVVRQRLDAAKPLSVSVVAPIKMRQFIFTHTSGPVPRHAVLGVGGCPITRGRGSARGLVQCRRGRIAEQREPVVDPLSGQALVSAGPLVPSPAPRA